MLDEDSNGKKIRTETDERGTTCHYDADGELHRDDGPAIETTNSKAWYRHGKLHRDDGPAVEITAIRDGSKNEWWLDGRQYTKEEFASIRLNIPRQKVPRTPHP